MSFFDLRVPLGWLFAILGVLLVIAGLRGASSVGARSLGMNINFIWGLVMVAFGLFCLWLARREARRRLGEASDRKKPAN
jgi:hypothetical protein